MLYISLYIVKKIIKSDIKSFLILLQENFQLKFSFKFFGFKTKPVYH